MNRSIKTLSAVVIPPAIVFLLCFLIIRIDIASSILLSFVTFLLTMISTRAKRKAYPRLDLPSGVMEEELAGLMKQAKADMDQVLYVAKHVKSKDVADNAMALYHLGEKIMEYLQRNPHKITKARRFFGYYLDTAKDILGKYYEFEITGIQAEEVDNIELKTSSALITLQEAFRKQYIQLATNELVDIEADIDLLQKTHPKE